MLSLSLNVLINMLVKAIPVRSRAITLSSMGKEHAINFG